MVAGPKEPPPQPQLLGTTAGRRGTLRWSWLLGPGPWIRAAETIAVSVCETLWTSFHRLSAVVFLAICLRCQSLASRFRPVDFRAQRVSLPKAVV